MEEDKRKLENEAEANGKRLEDDRGLKRVAPPLTGDEEVEEFYAILKRIQVAIKYFQRRDGLRCIGGEPAAKSPWNPSFRREDFDGVKADREHEKRDFDLNAPPASDASYSA